MGNFNVLRSYGFIMPSRTEGSRNGFRLPRAKGRQQPDLSSFDRNMMNGVRQKSDLSSFDKDLMEIEI